MRIRIFPDNSFNVQYPKTLKSFETNCSELVFIDKVNIDDGPVCVIVLDIYDRYHIIDFPTLAQFVELRNSFENMEITVSKYQDFRGIELSFDFHEQEIQFVHLQCSFRDELHWISEHLKFNQPIMEFLP